MMLVINLVGSDIIPIITDYMLAVTEIVMWLVSLALLFFFAEKTLLLNPK